MTTPVNQLSAVLKRGHYSLTKPRRAVFATLQGQEPQTMHELVARCRDIDRASIYRTVALFEQLGIVHRLQMGWKYKLELTDAFSHHHHHLSCTQCGNITALPEDPALERRLQALAAQYNFTAQDHQLEIRGLCSHCRLLA